jgi:hypothetical protein
LNTKQEHAHNQIIIEISSNEKRINGNEMKKWRIGRKTSTLWAVKINNKHMLENKRLYRDASAMPIIK